MTGMLRGGRAEYRRWDGEEEQLIEKIERKLGIGVIVTNVALIAGFFFFAAGMKSTGIDSGWGRRGSVGKSSSHISRTDCGYGRNGNRPEPDCEFYEGDQSGKKGSVYDLKFQKTWIASCDEAEFRRYTARRSVPTPQ